MHGAELALLAPVATAKVGTAVATQRGDARVTCGVAERIEHMECTELTDPTEITTEEPAPTERRLESRLTQRSPNLRPFQLAKAKRFPDSDLRGRNHVALSDLSSTVVQ